MSDRAPSEAMTVEVRLNLDAIEAYANARHQAHGDINARDRETLALVRELRSTRAALVKAGNAAGASLSEQCSTEFLCLVPEEVAGVVGKLRAQLAAETARAQEAERERTRIVALLYRADDVPQSCDEVVARVESLIEQQKSYSRGVHEMAAHRQRWDAEERGVYEDRNAAIDRAERAEKALISACHCDRRYPEHMERCPLASSPADLAAAYDARVMRVAEAVHKACVDVATVATDTTSPLDARRRVHARLKAINIDAIVRDTK